MWGYGARHAQLSNGTLDPLQAAAVVIRVGDRKLAIVGLDLGRSPDDPVDVMVSNQIVARGEVVTVAGSYGVRIRDVISPVDRMRSIGMEV